MSILVNNIRIPLEADTEEAFRTACARCDLPLGQVTASVYRESLDARRGTITRVLSVLLDGIPEEQALAYGEECFEGELKLLRQNPGIVFDGVREMLDKLKKAFE